LGIPNFIPNFAAYYGYAGVSPAAAASETLAYPVRPKRETGERPQDERLEYRYADHQSGYRPLTRKYRESIDTKGIAFCGWIIMSEQIAKE